eukprot:CAMPEP_0181292280 /NCGR_PEP_ID=MMETSP1101-20121128/2421_1 /TAXON_ID=46948 /ORGANISM="Rhodomonas abbreviata, Strain Caron Lab Isolate" /LENGTH=789 /DNA_ID=CAMNT_0023396737 /DNA_START=350 /DNA_END=2721 /DNA_ORIENTATION=+
MESKEASGCRDNRGSMLMLLDHHLKLLQRAPQAAQKLHSIQEEHTALLKLHACMQADQGPCPQDTFSPPPEVLQTQPPPSDIEEKPQDFPVIGLLIVGTGGFLLSNLMWKEYSLYSSKSEYATECGGDMKFTFSEFVQYRLDHYFSQSKLAKPILLLGVTFIVILTSSAFMCLSGDHDLSLAMWKSWTYVADPGTHADAEGLWHRWIAFWTTIGGMLVFAMMIGIISESIGEKVDELKKGKSRVIESNHTLMLGWNDKSLAIIQQIALANESEGGGALVVLADRDKEELEDLLRAAVESRENGLRLLGTQVIFRSGNPLAEHELTKVAVETARAVIALSPDGLDPDEADSRMVRQVLSLKGSSLKAHVVVEMQDVDNRDLVNMIGQDMVEVIVAHDVIGRLMIQCARAPGLAHVLENMMGFEGAEFYLKNWPELEGKKFSDITCRFDDAIPIGLKRIQHNEILLNPANDMLIEEGDEIMVLAEDDDSYEVNDGTFPIKHTTLPQIEKYAQPPEKMLFCGWRRDMSDMIKDLESSVAVGSELWLFNTVEMAHRNEMLLDKGNKEELVLKNLTIKNAVGNPIVRKDLMNIVDKEKKETIPLDEFDSVLVLADSVAIEHGADMESSDSRSLASLLIIKDIQKNLREEKIKRGEKIKMTDPISEILDTRTRGLLRVVECAGYVMSNQIVSAAIAQVAECRDLNSVLGELLSSAATNEPQLIPITYYLDVDSTTDNPCSFWDVCRQARLRNEVAIGYKPEDVQWAQCARTLLNPPDKAEPRVWKKDDQLVVIAE